MATKVYQDKTVLQASKERISLVFDSFEKIYISFSGGKDSSVMSHLVLQEAKKRIAMNTAIVDVDRGFLIVVNIGFNF